MTQKNHPVFNSPVIAYAHHKIILDANGNPIDFEFLEVNPTFEKLTGLKASEIIGKTASNVIIEEKENISNLISCFGDIALHGGENEYDQFYRLTGKWYNVHVYSVEKMTFTTLYTDINLRKLTYDLLIESQTNYEELADSITDIYFAMDENLVYTYWNKASEQFTGISAKDAIGKSMTDLFPETPDNNRAKNIYLEVIKTKQTKSFINEFRTENQVLYFEINAYPTKKGVSVFVKDISQRIKFEKKIQEERHLIQNYLDTANVVIVTLDVEGCVTMINRFGQDLLGYTKNELIGLNWFDKILPQQESKEIIVSAFKKIINGELEPVRYVENEVLCKNGETRFIAWSNNYLFDSEQVIIGTISSGIDITEIKKIEKEKLETAQRLLYANKATNDVIWDWDVETDTQQWNEAGTKVFGWTEIVEHPVSAAWWVERVHQDDRDRIHDSFFSVVNAPEQHIWQDEYLFLKKDGTYASVADRGYVIRDDKGKAIRMIGAMHDITVEKHAEEEKEKLQNQLAQAQKMESVGRLAGGVAHDFNNMLSVILGHTELALLSMEKTDKLYEDLVDIQKAAQRSADLTKQLLAFARKQTIQPKKINLNETVDDMLKMLRRLIGEDIELIWEPEEMLWPVWLDPTQLDQILANLCVNARDAISGVGKITIKTDNVLFDDDFCMTNKTVKLGDYVCLSVNDTGCGMDDDTISHLFEPFFTTKEKDFGSGLGLATVYGIVKQNYGFILVESSINQGSTIKIFFPCYRDEKITKHEINKQQTLSYGKGTILLVEDETAILRMTAMMLSKIGYSVLTACSPLEAIRLAAEQSGSIDLLLTDVIMPEMNGYDLVNRISEIYPAVKTVFMSGYTADIISLHGVIKQGVNFIQKPFSIADLSAKIKEVLDN